VNIDICTDVTNSSHADVDFCLASSTGLKCMHINIRSILPKMDELKAIVLDQNVDILSVNETNLDSTVPDSEIAIDGYNIFRCDLTRISGGVLLYVKQEYNAKPVNLLNNTNLQIKWIKLPSFFGTNKNLLLCSLYRPPNSKVEYFNQIIDNIEKAVVAGDEIVILGDLNIDVAHDKRQGSNGIIKLENLFSITQLIQNYTRVTIDTKTLIDVILCTAPQHHIASGVIKYTLSDHYAIYTVIQNKFKHKQLGHKYSTFRDYKRFVLHDFLNDLHSSLSNEFAFPCKFSNVDSAWYNWKRIFNKVSDDHAPLKTFRTRSKPNSFITPEIRSLMYRRDYLHKKAVQYSDNKLWNDYRTLRNNITSLISRYKKQYYSTRIHEAEGDIGLMWNTIKDALAASGNTNHNPISELSADDFNTYFSTIGKEVAECFKSNNNLHNNSIRPQDHSFTFSIVSPNLVCHLLRSLGYNRSNVDILDMDSRLLSLSANITCSSLTYIINMSIETSTLPDDWKLARVTPIYKNKGNREDAVNYRPISVLPHIAKLIETCIKEQILNFFKVSKLITPHQSAYLEKHSTITALHKMVDDWYTNINNGSITAACFLDLTKCFDTVDHNILLTKLSSYGFNSSALNWLKAYLTNRKQKVRLNSTLSESKTINIGVPQGSILGPILFLIFINDIPSCLRYCTCCIYADDITLYFSSTLLKDAEDKLQSDLDQVIRWFTQNKLLVNAKKSNCMIISSNVNVNTQSLTVTINDTPLDQVNNFKLLGLYIDSQLSWKIHLDHLLKLLAPKVGVLCRLSKLLPPITLQTIYNTIIQPHIDYAISIWGSCAGSYLIPIQRLQNRAARAVTHTFDYNVSVSGILHNLKIMNITERYTYFTLNLIYKSLNNLCPDYLSSLFQYVSSIHSRATRQSTRNLLYIPKPNLECFKKSFQYAAATLWNELSEDIKNATSLSMFKYMYKMHLFPN
jgi:exonuclease III